MFKVATVSAEGWLADTGAGGACAREGAAIEPTMAPSIERRLIGPFTT
jgi:hypothetical protein